MAEFTLSKNGVDSSHYMVKNLFKIACIFASLSWNGLGQSNVLTRVYFWKLDMYFPNYFIVQKKQNMVHLNMNGCMDLV